MFNKTLAYPFWEHLRSEAYIETLDIVFIDLHRSYVPHAIWYAVFAIQSINLQLIIVFAIWKQYLQSLY